MFKKVVLGLTIALAAVVMAPGVSSAATITNVQFENGDVEVQGKGGATVHPEFRIVVGPGEVVEFIQTDVISDDLGPVDHNVGGNLGLQEGTHYMKVPVKLPPNTGTFDLNVQTAGIFGGQRAINGDDSVNGSNSFSGAIRVVASGSSSSTPVGGDDDTPVWLSSLLSQMQALIAKLSAPAPTPTKPVWCAQLSAKLVGTQYGTYSPANGALQTFLIQNGYAGVITYGATSYYGVQTSAAVSQAQAACS